MEPRWKWCISLGAAKEDSQSFHHSTKAGSAPGNGPQDIADIRVVLDTPTHSSRIEIGVHNCTEQVNYVQNKKEPS
jgi:hypothetical protein